MVEVSVIIINYNTRETTLACINTVVEQSRDIAYEIIVVDNASTDGSRECFAADKRIKYMYNGENVGFGRANNIGMRVAQGKYLFLLNSDTLLIDNALKIFYDAAESFGSRLGAMGCILLDKQQRPTHSYGQFITIGSSLSEPFLRLWNRLAHKESKMYRPTIPSGNLYVDYVSGADMFVPRNVFEQTGGFDKDFFMYAEDVDWQYRMSKAGLDRIIIGGPHIIHLEGGSDASQRRQWSFSRLSNALRSRMLYIKKHNSCLAYIMFRFLFAIIRTPFVFAAGGYTFEQKRALLRLLTIGKL